MKRIFATATALLGALAFVTPSANAATVGGYAGLPNQSSQASCFSESWGTVANHGTCGSSPLVWEIPLYTNAVGTYTVNATTACSQSTTCEVFSMYNDGFNYATTASSGPALSSDMWQIGNPIYVPTDGYLYAACWIPAADCGWQSVNWYF